MCQSGNSCLKFSIFKHLEKSTNTVQNLQKVYILLHVDSCLTSGICVDVRGPNLLLVSEKTLSAAAKEWKSYANARGGLLYPCYSGHACSLNDIVCESSMLIYEWKLNDHWQWHIDTAIHAPTTPHEPLVGSYWLPFCSLVLGYLSIDWLIFVLISCITAACLYVFMQTLRRYIYSIFVVYSLYILYSLFYYIFN